MKELERAFSQTTKLMLGTELQGLDDYRQWLGRRVPLPHQGKSALSGKEVWIPPARNYLGKEFNPSKIISMDEMGKACVSPFSPVEVKAATVAGMLAKFTRPISFNCGNVRYQAHENVEKCSGAGGGRNLYYDEDVYQEVKNVAYSNYTLYSENMFGCHGVSHSSFCIHTYNSTAVNRCFEVDGCSNSRDLLFCHDCENVNDSMFCFNAKNLRFAIGNVPLPTERYRQVRALLSGGMAAELARSKALGWDIYNIGSGGTAGHAAGQGER